MPLSSLPALENLARQGNRKCRTARPTEPLDLKYTISTENIPQDFLQQDIIIDDRQHLLFATQEQLMLLKKSKALVR